MPKYTLTVNTGPNEEFGLASVTAKYNASMRSANPDWVDLTNKQYLDYILDSVIKDYKRQYKEQLKQQASDAVVFD